MKQRERNIKKYFKLSGTMVGAMLAFGFMLLCNRSFAQERQNVAMNSLEYFNDTDLNSDQRWDREEFDQRMKNEMIFQEWDSNKDKKLTNKEIEEGANNNWNKVRHVIGNYYIIEVNENDGLDTEKIANPRLDLDRIDDWDLNNDGYYSEAEMNSGVFDYFDSDNDDYLDYDEYSSSSVLRDQYTD